MKFVWIVFACISYGLTISFSAPTISPMAKLMRQMLQYLDTEKSNIEKQLPAQPFPKTFDKINTANLTPGKRPSSDHSRYIENFQSALNEYYATKEITQRRLKFNVLVNTCIQCHQRECPGPVQRIERNLVP